MAAGHEGKDRVDTEDAVCVDRALEQKTELDSVLRRTPHEATSARLAPNTRAVANGPLCMIENPFHRVLF